MHASSTIRAFALPYRALQGHPCKKDAAFSTQLSAQHSNAQYSIMACMQTRCWTRWRQVWERADYDEDNYEEDDYDEDNYAEDDHGNMIMRRTIIRKTIMRRTIMRRMVAGRDILPTMRTDIESLIPFFSPFSLSSHSLHLLSFTSSFLSTCTHTHMSFHTHTHLVYTHTHTHTHTHFVFPIHTHIQALSLHTRLFTYELIIFVLYLCMGLYLCMNTWWIFS